MRLKQLGWTDLNLSAIGLGTWAIGGAKWKYGWGPQDDNDSIATVRRALELGVNWIDTAAIYGIGHSEEVIGRALEGSYDRALIATKCSRVCDKEGNITGCLKKESIRAELEESLKRLKIEVIDLYQIHGPDPDSDLEEAWGEIGELIKEGKIRYAGVSNFKIEQMKRLQSIHPIASLQAPYSMLRRDIENEILDFCAMNNIGVLAYSPLQKGLLTGKFTKEKLRTLPEDDHRLKDSFFFEPRFSLVLSLVDKLKELAEKRGGTMQQLAIAWVLKRHEVTSAIVGARYPKQIEESVGGTDWIIPKEDSVLIDKLLKEVK